MFKKNLETFGILEIALFNKIPLSWQDERMEVFLNNEFSSPGVSEICV